MPILPASSGQPQRPGARGLGETPGAPAARPQGGARPRPPADHADSVDFSPAVRELLDLERPAISDLSAARLRQVSQRLTEGFYDRPEVRSEVMLRVARDLTA